jgi:hypothetical protein
MDENSLLSIDVDYDPEAAIELEYFERISRIVDYKDIILLYMRKSPFNFADKKAVLSEFRDLLKPVTILKASMIEVDKFL